MEIFNNLLFTLGGGFIIVVLGILAMVAKWYRKAAQWQALVKQVLEERKSPLMAN